MSAIQQMLIGEKGTPTLTYTTYDPSHKGSYITLSNGNLTETLSTGSGAVTSIIGKSSGKWYWEVLVDTSGTEIDIGVGTLTCYVESYPGSGIDALEWAYSSSGLKLNNGSSLAYGASFTTGDRIGVALDMNGGTLIFYKNNVSQGVAYTGLTGTLGAIVGGGGPSLHQTTTNFGATTLTYTPPSGYNAGLYV